LQHVSNIANSGRNPHQQEQNGLNDGVNGSKDQNNGGKDNQRNVEDNMEVLSYYNMIITGLVRIICRKVMIVT
jgi:hypothetical protein